MNSCCLLTNQLCGELSPAEWLPLFKIWPSVPDSERSPVQLFKGWYWPRLEHAFKEQSLSALKVSMGPGSWERWVVKLHRRQHTVRPTNTPGWNNTISGNPMCPKLYQFFPVLSAPNHVFPFGSNKHSKTCRTAFIVWKLALQVPNWRVF